MGEPGAVGRAARRRPDLVDAWVRRRSRGHAARAHPAASGSRRGTAPRHAASRGRIAFRTRASAASARAATASAKGPQASRGRSGRRLRAARCHSGACAAGAARVLPV